MSRIRAVVTMPWTTALPQDVSINTFHFLTTSTPSTLAEQNEIFTALEQFYNTSSGVLGDQISGWISQLVSRTAGACEIELFDLADPEPRIPVNSSTFTMGAADSTSLSPPEVALCLSFQAVPISGVPQARRRGRVFIGPLTNNGMIDTATGRPVAALVNALAAAGNFLHDTMQAPALVRWTIYSRAGDAMAEVDNGWCDNEFDTMRSRGRLSTSRTTFS